MIVQMTKEDENLYRKKYLCPVCKRVIKRETWDSKRCFGEGTILKDNTVPRYCPNCGTPLSCVNIMR